MSITETAPLRRDKPARRPIAVVRTALRLLVAALLVASGVCLIAFEHAVREAETWISVRVIDLLFAEEAVHSFIGTDPAVAFGIGERWWALRVTAECSIALYTGPLLILAGLAGCFARFATWRILTASAALVVGLMLLNQVRLAGLAYVYSQFGKDAFDWAHSLGGSFLMLFGLAGALFFFFRFVVAGKVNIQRRPPRAPRTSP